MKDLGDAGGECAPVRSLLRPGGSGAILARTWSLGCAVAFAVAGLTAADAWAQPVNDTCAGALSLSAAGPFPMTAAAVDVSRAADEPEEPLCARSHGTVWYEFTPATSGVYRFDSCGGGTVADTVLGLFTGGCGALTPVPGACSDDSGGACARKSLVQVSLEAGTRYFVQVGSFSELTGSSPLTLQLTLANPTQPKNDVCGGALAISAAPSPSVSEVTDLAGATRDGDPSAQCAAGASYGVWYTFRPNSSGAYRFATCAGETGTTVRDTVLAVFTSSGDCQGPFAPVVGGCSDTAGGSCGDQSAAVASLDAGTTYYVIVGQGSASPLGAPRSSAALVVQPVLAPVNDACSASPAPLTLDLPVAVSTGATAARALAVDDARLGGGLACFQGQGHSVSAAAGRDLVYEFLAPRAGDYSFRLGAPQTYVNSVLSMTSTCRPTVSSPTTYEPPECLAAANRNPSTLSGQEELSCRGLVAGERVYLWVDEDTLSTSGATMTLEANACTRESAAANDIPALAGPLACPVTGAIVPAGDVDFFGLGVPPVAGARVFALVEGAAASAPNFDLRVTTETDTLEFDDADLDVAFGAQSPVIAGTELPQAPSYLRVSHASPSTAAEPYRLYSVVQTAQPAPETEPNDALEQPSTSPSNYFSGEVSSATDVDLFLVDASPGDLLFVALDGFPTRAGVGANFNPTLALLDAEGQVLLAVNDGATAVQLAPSPSTLTGTTPAVPAEGFVHRVRAPGPYYVRVGKSAGWGTTPVANPYRLSIARGCRAGGGVGAPRLDGLSPGQGSTAGGNAVSIIGEGFLPGTVVRFGEVRATVVSRTRTELTVAVPPGAPGLVDVSVSVGSAPGATLVKGYRYVEPPVLGELVPARGPTSGGTSVTVNGGGFQRGATVTLGPRAPLDVTWVDSTRLTLRTAPNPKGTYSVTVTNPDGMTGSAHNAFEFLAAPALTSVSPSTGSSLGGTALTLQGEDFAPAAVVKLDGVVAAATASGTPTRLYVVTPPVAAGPKVVEVMNPDSQRSSLVGGFTAIDPPTLAEVTPSVGASTGREPVTLTGGAFVAGAVVRFGVAEATNVVVLSPTMISVETPGQTPGVVAVMVTNPDGQVARLADAFTFVSSAPPPRLQRVEPAAGPSAGGTEVSIGAANLLAGARVFFHDSEATCGPVDLTAGTVSCATPPYAFGPVAVTLRNADFQQDTVAAAFTYVAPLPRLASPPVEPSSGPTAGGTRVEILGEGFLDGVTVTVGGRPCAGPRASSPGRVTCTTPPGSPGVADLVVANPDGNTTQAHAAFTFVPPPKLTGLMPAEGPTEGGTVVTLEGADFVAPVSVRFGSSSAVVGALVEASTLRVEAPPGRVGVVDVTVTNADGQSATASGVFAYVPPPVLTAISPTRGPASGGASVTLTGVSFRPGLEVSFNLGAVVAPAMRVVVDSATRARCTTPAMGAGLATVRVRNTDGQTGGLEAAFTIVPPPVVTAVVPGSGLTGGGDEVTVTGRDLRAGATVRFGAAMGVGVVVAADGNSLRVRTPARANAGPVDVIVTNDDAQSTVLARGFTYRFPPPVLVAVTPASGPTAGGTTLTLIGSDFLVGVTVAVAGFPAGVVARGDATSLTAVAPPLGAGPADVEVRNPDGQTATLAGAFVAVAAPTLAAVSPAAGPARGGARLELSGAGFLPGAQVRLGGAAAVAVSVTSSTTAWVTTSARAPGVVEVELLNPDGQSTRLLAAYAYEPGPGLDRLEPTAGRTTGGTLVRLVGAHFRPGALVLVDDVPEPSVVVLSSTALTMKAPPHAAAVVSIVVRNPDGQSAELKSAFRYEAPPALASVSPGSGPARGGTLLRLSGVGFAEASSVTFDGVPSPMVVRLDASTLSVLSPRHPPGAVEIVVIAPTGAEARLPTAFVYEATAPTVTAVAPLSGPLDGGARVAVMGADFAPGAAVMFGGQAATEVIVSSAGIIFALTPPHPPGEVAVAVMNPGGMEGVRAKAYRYAIAQANPMGLVTDGGTGGLSTGEAGRPSVPLRGGGWSCASAGLGPSGWGFAAVWLALLGARRRSASPGSARLMG